MADPHARALPGAWGSPVFRVVEPNGWEWHDPSHRCFARVGAASPVVPSYPFGLATQGRLCCSWLMHRDVGERRVRDTALSFGSDPLLHFLASPIDGVPNRLEAHAENCALQATAAPRNVEILLVEEAADRPVVGLVWEHRAGSSGSSLVGALPSHDPNVLPNAAGNGGPNRKSTAGDADNKVVGCVR